jgi:hypothetical protein
VSDSTGERDLEQYDLERLEALIEQDPGAPEFPALAEAYRRAGRAEDARRVSEVGLQHAPARLAGHVSLGLALLDLNQLEAAQGELAGILDAVLEPHRTMPRVAEHVVEERAEAHESEPLIAAEPSPEEPTVDAAPEDGVMIGDFQPAEAASVSAREQRGSFSAGLDDSEIDQAFEAAESQPEEMVSANRMAERVLLDHAPRIEEEAIAADQHAPSAGAEELEFAPTSSPIFHTQTMANLLEQQGDHRGAREIRDSLDESAAEQAEESLLAAEALEEEPMDAAEVPETDDSPPSPGSGRKTQVLTTLESWLHNLRRGVQ